MVRVWRDGEEIIDIDDGDGGRHGCEASACKLTLRLWHITVIRKGVLFRQWTTESD